MGAGRPRGGGITCASGAGRAEPPAAAELLLALHGRALRLVARLTGQHQAGLSQAAREHRLSSRLARQCRELDAASGWIRHVTEPRCDAFLAELGAALTDGGGEAGAAAAARGAVVGSCSASCSGSDAGWAGAGGGEAAAVAGAGSTSGSSSGSGDGSEGAGRLGPEWQPKPARPLGGGSEPEAAPAPRGPELFDLFDEDSAGEAEPPGAPPACGGGSAAAGADAAAGATAGQDAAAEEHGLDETTIERETVKDGAARVQAEAQDAAETIIEREVGKDGAARVQQDAATEEQPVETEEAEVCVGSVHGEVVDSGLTGNPKEDSGEDEVLEWDEVLTTTEAEPVEREAQGKARDSVDGVLKDRVPPFAMGLNGIAGVAKEDVDATLVEQAGSEDLGRTVVLDAKCAKADAVAPAAEEDLQHLASERSKVDSLDPLVPRWAGLEDGETFADSNCEEKTGRTAILDAKCAKADAAVPAAEEDLQHLDSERSKVDTLDPLVPRWADLEDDAQLGEQDAEAAAAAAAGPEVIREVPSPLAGGKPGKASGTYRQRADEIRYGDVVMLHGRPCWCWQAGRRRRARTRIAGTGIFTGIWLEEEFPASRLVSVPHVKVTDYQLVRVFVHGENAGCIELLSFDGSIRKVLCLEPLSEAADVGLRDEGVQIANIVLEGMTRVLEGKLDSKAITIAVTAACGEEIVSGVRIAGEDASVRR